MSCCYMHVSCQQQWHSDHASAACGDKPRVVTWGIPAPLLGYSTCSPCFILGTFYKTEKWDGCSSAKRSRVNYPIHEASFCHEGFKGEVYRDPLSPWLSKSGVFTWKWGAVFSSFLEKICARHLYVVVALPREDSPLAEPHLPALLKFSAFSCICKYSFILLRI